MVPLVIDTHAVLLDAVQPQPDAAVTVALPLSPPAAMEADVGATAYVHGANCVTVTSWPAIDSVVDRADAVGLAWTEKLTVPLPEPDAMDVTDTHAFAAATVH